MYKVKVYQGKIRLYSIISSKNVFATTVPYTQYKRYNITLRYELLKALPHYLIYILSYFIQKRSTQNSQGHAPLQLLQLQQQQQLELVYNEQRCRRIDQHRLGHWHFTKRHNNRQSTFITATTSCTESTAAASSQSIYQ